jgi:hypothetical protein
MLFQRGSRMTSMDFKVIEVVEEIEVNQATSP